MIPGLPADMLAGSDEEGSLRMKRMIFITDSMTAAELDSDGHFCMEHGKMETHWTDLARDQGRQGERYKCTGSRRIAMSVSNDGQHGQASSGKNGWYVVYK